MATIVAIAGGGHRRERLVIVAAEATITRLKKA